MKKTCIVIPARFNSSRFPGKPLANLIDKPMIIWVAEIANQVLPKNDIFIATDSKLIEKKVLEHNFQCILTGEAITGTDRVAIASKELDYDFFINIQGDEPLLNFEDIKKCIELKNKYPQYIFNGFNIISSDEDPKSANIPKVVTNEKDDLIYISRSLIPSQKDLNNIAKIKYKKQVCIYGFSKDELNLFNDFGKKSHLENIEDIEILRFFELNIRIKMFECSKGSIAVDVPGDLKKAEKLLLKKYKI